MNLLNRYKLSYKFTVCYISKSVFYIIFLFHIVLIGLSVIVMRISYFVNRNPVSFAIFPGIFHAQRGNISNHIFIFSQTRLLSK